MFSMEFGILLTQYRERLRLKKTALANKLEVGLSYIQHIEAGRSKPPRYEICQKMSGILQLTAKERKHFLKTAFNERANEDEKKFLEGIYSDKNTPEMDEPGIKKISMEVLDALSDPTAVKSLMLVHQNQKELKRTILSVLENLTKMDPEKRKAIEALCQ